jgi:hypothetical protein
MPSLFIVDGPYEVPFYSGSAGRTITDKNVREFWVDKISLASSRGCYVFGIRASRGFTPGYIGKATRTFKQEVFQHHKLTRYQQFLVDYRKGPPVLFFLLAPNQKGARNMAHVAELESFLIQTGLAANPHLLNVRGTKAEEWGISGLLRSGRGKPSKPATAFRRMMKLPTR